MQLVNASVLSTLQDEHHHHQSDCACEDADESSSISLKDAIVVVSNTKAGLRYEPDCACEDASDDQIHFNDCG